MASDATEATGILGAWHPGKCVASWAWHPGGCEASWARRPGGVRVILEGAWRSMLARAPTTLAPPTLTFRAANAHTSALSTRSRLGAASAPTPGRAGQTLRILKYFEDSPRPASPVPLLLLPLLLTALRGTGRGQGLGQAVFVCFMLLSTKSTRRLNAAAAHPCSTTAPASLSILACQRESVRARAALASACVRAYMCVHACVRAHTHTPCRRLPSPLG